jgi:hypothetical protein
MIGPNGATPISVNNTFDGSQLSSAASQLALNLLSAAGALGLSKLAGPGETVYATGNVLSPVSVVPPTQPPVNSEAISRLVTFGIVAVGFLLLAAWGTKHFGG